MVASIISSGTNRIVGGVLLDGETSFVVESDDGETALDVGSLRLQFDDGAVFVEHNGVRYLYDMHEALVCPLAQFVRRGGEVAYSIPSDGSDAASDRLRSLGLVQLSGIGSWVAREFSSSELVLLLHAMDFAEEVQLPSNIENSIRNRVNSLTGAGNTTSTDWSSYFNTASMSNITTYLITSNQTVEIAGIPLRFYWVTGSVGRDPVSRVTAFSQDLGSNTLTNLSALNLPSVNQLGIAHFLLSSELFDQIDFISAYQSAALFRTFNDQDSTSFSRFSTAACL